MNDYSEKGVCTVSAPPIQFYLDFCGPCGFLKYRNIRITNIISVNVPYCNCFDTRLERADKYAKHVADIERCAECLQHEDATKEEK